MHDGQRYKTVKKRLVLGTLWFQIPLRGESSAPVQDDTPALFVLVLMLLCAPAATWLVAQSLNREFRHIARALGDLGHGGDALYAVNSSHLSNSLPGVPICSNDETGDLAVELNKACRHFEQSNKRLMEELRLAAQSDRSQSQFLTLASQQLKAPIEGILADCHHLKSGTLSEALANNVDTIKKASLKLSSHVTDMLHLSGLDDWQQVPLRPERRILWRWWRRFCEPSASKCRQMSLSIHHADDSPLLVDRTRIQQVIENLIGNALKFASQFVRVTVSNGRFPDGSSALHFQCWDSGPGLKEDELKVIFSEFYRSPQHRNIPGTGLGLAIAQRLVERHSGLIWAESVLGEGSVFHVLLPTGETR